MSHAQLIDLTLESIHGAGFKLDKELYSSAREGSIANGRFTISDISDNEMQLQIAWQNSYDKSRTLKFAIGSRVFICDNGCVSSDFGHFKRKHMGEVQTFTPQAITEYIKSAAEVFLGMQKQRDMMKNIELTERVKAELIGRMFIEEGFLISTQMSAIQKELRKPTYDYGAPNSLWELYNFTTFVMKETHPSFWLENHIAAHDFFIGFTGAAVKVQPILIEEPQSPFVQLDLFDELYNQPIEDAPQQSNEIHSEPVPEEDENVVYNSDDDNENDL